MSDSLPEAILRRAIDLGATVTTAESCTGGMVAAALTDIAGSSAVFERGFVTYSNQAKVEMLDVEPASLEAHGAVSEQVAREMAQGALRKARAAVAVAISGIAGPGGSERKPEGRVCFAVATKDDVDSETIEFGALGRGNVRRAARDHALSLLKTALDKL